MEDQFTPQLLQERLAALPPHVVYGQLMGREDWGVAMQQYVPEHMRKGFIAYIAFGGNRAGGFLAALMSNDLMGSYRSADHINLKNMHNWCIFLHNYAPMTCFGSKAAFDSWPGILTNTEEENNANS